MNVMKGIRQKNGGTYNPMVPFGADGQFIDMFSDLNLEYELKVGPRHLAAIETVSDTITDVIENYATPTDVTTPNAEFYRVKTRIDGTGEIIDPSTVITAVITAQLYWVKVVSVNPELEEEETLLKTKQSTITEITIEPEEEGDPTIVNYNIEEVYIED